MLADTKDIELLVRDKYNGDRTANIAADVERLALGEPLAYVIGWIPFLGLRIRLDSHPLIPRPETEWWTEVMLEELHTRFVDVRFTLLDLCAGSGAIGLAVLKGCPNAQVSFGELSEEHSALIRTNIAENALEDSRADIRTGNLFDPFVSARFDVIATNPPYIPRARVLDASVRDFEPSEALFAGPNGLSIIERIAAEARFHLNEGGMLYMECDTDNIHDAAELLLAGGAHTIDIRTDLYGRERLVVAYY